MPFADPDRRREFQRDRSRRPDVRAKNGAWAKANPEKRKRWQRAWRKKNPAKVRAAQRRNDRASRDRLWALKSKPCLDCRKTFHPCQMDFDHRPGEKKVISIGKHRRSGERVIKEIEKCDVVCANCHRLRTWNRLQAAAMQSPT